MGKQCQLRSLRAHINPDPTCKSGTWIFYGYWEEKRQVEQYRLAAQPVGVNVTYYLQDNGPGDGHLKYVENGHLQEPPHLYPMDRPNSRLGVRPRSTSSSTPRRATASSF